ncbi:hypothetical protein G7054_g10541 [Neopestalotiopsis clavispora]|nr:hypothetical protein G7054_g10541 [Neopestalotiopsis clavispora]
MICRRCLTSASSLTRTIPHRAAPVILRSFASTTIQRNAAPAAAPAAPSTSENPTFSTPLGDAATAAAAEAKPALSACAEGTVLNGLNYLKNKTDPVALADDAYPAWLWSCLDVTVKKSDDAGAADAEAEFCTEIQEAAPNRRQAPALPRGQAPGRGQPRGPGAQDPPAAAVDKHAGQRGGHGRGRPGAVAAREDLRKAMRKERRSKIKEANYLKSM